MAKWKLMTTGKNEPSFLAVCKALETFNLWNDSQCKLIDEFRYQELIQLGEIDPEESYSGIKKGKIGVIAQSDYSRFTVTWQKMWQFESDYLTGWNACAKSLNKKTPKKIKRRNKK